MSVGRVGGNPMIYNNNQSPFNATRILEALDSVSELSISGERAASPMGRFPTRAEVERQRRVESEPPQTRVPEPERKEESSSLSDDESSSKNSTQRNAPSHSSRQRQSSLGQTGDDTGIPSKQRRASGTRDSFVEVGKPYNRPRKASSGTGPSTKRDESSSEESLDTFREARGKRRPSKSDATTATEPSTRSSKAPATSTKATSTSLTHASKPALGSHLKAKTFTTRRHARAPASVRWKFSALSLDNSDDEDEDDEDNEMGRLKNVPPVPVIVAPVSQPSVSATITARGGETVLPFGIQADTFTSATAEVPEKTPQPEDAS
ncbi:hypothetical protein H4R33_007245, partial [Dimargaris cristalligena]